MESGEGSKISLYHSCNIGRVIKSSRLRWTGHEARMEEGRGAFKISTGKPTGNNIRMYLKEIGISTRN
jgi:hypothetical protein